MRSIRWMTIADASVFTSASEMLIAHTTGRLIDFALDVRPNFDLV